MIRTALVTVLILSPIMTLSNLVSINSRESNSIIPLTPSQNLPTESSVDVTPTSIPTPPALSTITSSGQFPGWNKYTNIRYNFSFEYPNNLIAYDSVDYSDGVIPVVAYFGYVDRRQYELGDKLSTDKMGGARILIWADVQQNLKSWVQVHEHNIDQWIDAQIGGMAALVHYSRAITASDGDPMTFKTYYLKTGDRIFEIMGFSITNQYSDSWIETFDKVVATFKFTD